MSEVAILIPVLNRPHRVAPLLDSIRAATPQPHRVLFLTDPFDTDEIAEIEACGAWHERTGGNYARKINAGIDLTDEPLIFTGADDLNFHPGWFDAAKQCLTPGIGVVGTQDLCNARVKRGEHSTHSLVTREYVDRCGTIDEVGKLLHEGYPHEFVDDELIETAKSRGAFAFAHESVVEHLHPLAGKAPMDDLYAAQRVRMKQGRRIFNRRRALWT